MDCSMWHQNTLTKDEIEGMVARYVETNNVSLVAREYNIDRSSVRYHVKRAGTRMGTRTDRPVVQEVARRLLQRPKREKQKYDHILYERVNRGHSYATYCQKAGIKVPEWALR